MTAMGGDEVREAPLRFRPRVREAGAADPSPTGRLDGLDLARGLAILGMFVAHTLAVGVDATPDATAGRWLLGMSHGRSAVLFALLAGISLGILTGWPRPLVGEPAVRARLRVLVRSMGLLAVSGVLVLLDTPVYLILGAYALWFVVALPCARRSARWLIVAAGIVVLVGPQVRWLLVTLSGATGLVVDSGVVDDFFLETLVSGIYPGLAYLAVVLAGLAVTRLDPRRRDVQWGMVGVGAVLALVGYAVGNVVFPLVAPHWWGLESMAVGAEWEQVDPALMLNSAPHAGTTFEMLGSGGVALAVTGLALLAPRGVLRVLAPVSAMGSMALSAYCLHVVVIAMVPALVGETGPLPPLVMIVGIMALCWAWRTSVGRGPLERALRWLSTRATSAPPRDPRPTRP